MSGISGNDYKNWVKISWDQFKSWQRWDELPDEIRYPPMTVDMTFMYNNETYYLDVVNHKYAILNSSWGTVLNYSQ